MLACGLGVLWWQGGQDLATARDGARRAAEALAVAQADVAVAGPGTAAGPDPRPVIVAEARRTDIDWVAVRAALDDHAAPLGVDLSSFTGTAYATSAQPATAVPAPEQTVDGGTVAVTGPGDLAALAPVMSVGVLDLAGTAPAMPVIADWLDLVAADPRFTDVWIAAVTPTEAPDGSGVVLQFTAHVAVSDRNLVVRPALEAQP